LTRRVQAHAPGRWVRISVDGEPVEALAGETVATALLASGYAVFRYSPRGRAPRAPFCFMGTCQDCVVRIDGHLTQSCMTPVGDGMRVERPVPGEEGG
jgi:predicted molibdopterin-dependent oxidoreductase YjgC